MDATGQSNDNRSIYLENTQQLERDAESPGYEGPEWDFTKDTFDQYHDYEESEVKSKDKGLTHKIEIPEHLRRLLNGNNNA